MPTIVYEFTRRGLVKTKNPPQCVVFCSDIENDFNDIRFLKDVNLVVEKRFCGCCSVKQMFLSFMAEGQSSYNVMRQNEILIAHPEISQKLINKVQFAWSEARLVAVAL